MLYPKRGDIFLVNLDPAKGKEIKKTRPALVVQNDILNQYSPLIIVCPITSTITKGETRIFVKARKGGLENDSIILTQQIRCIDKSRLIKKLGGLDKNTIKQVDQALKITIGLLPI